MNLLVCSQLPIPLSGPLQKDQERHWPAANKDIIWGWKRDVGLQSRSVYFSGSLARDADSVVLDRYFFNFRTKIAGNPDSLIGDVERARERFAACGNPTDLKVNRWRDLTTVEFRFGQPTEIDQDRVYRLKLRRPRKRISAPKFPPPTDTIRVDPLWPADLYVGSGVSYEAGLPTLCDMHDAFCVDNETQEGFTVGASDPLPRLLAEEGSDRLVRFCQVHAKALFVGPTLAMRAIADLVAAVKVRRIFTDNVDNLLCKTGVAYERVRGSGVFNERHKVAFASPRLIVVGVAADRRQIIRQARAARLDVIVVNPCKKVSPNVTHLEYVRLDDLFFKWEAQRFFREALDQSRSCLSAA
jgi:hypothetical protein